MASSFTGRRTLKNTIALFRRFLERRGATALIKSKSMLTEECGLREHLTAAGVEVVETDLGERIQQLDGEDPSHVVVPAVHKLRTDVARVFAATIGSDPDDDDPPHLAEAQRMATRPLILRAAVELAHQFPRGVLVALRLV